MANSNNSYIKQLDPIKGLVDYVLDIKPYHTKIVDVMIEYVYNDDAVAVIKEDLQLAWGPTKFDACVIGGELVVPCNVEEGGAIQPEDIITINYLGGSPETTQQVTEVVGSVFFDGTYSIITLGGSPIGTAPITTTHILVPADVAPEDFSFDVLSIDEENQTITVSGAATANIFNGQQIRITPSGNVYTVQGSLVFNGTSTILPITESLDGESVGGSPSSSVRPVRWYIPCGNNPC